MKRVLVIDDAENIREFLEDALMSLGYEAKIACDGKEGITLIDNGYNCDLVITDIDMPRMDGNAVAKHLRTLNRPDLQVVAITGSGDSVRNELFDFVLIKPFTLKTLKKVISLVTTSQ